MAALTVAPGSSSGSRGASAAAFQFGRVARSAVLALTGLYFVVPLAASARYALQGVGGTWTLAAVTALFHDGALWDALETSTEVAAGAAVVTLLLLTPTSVSVSLWMPKMRTWMEALTLLPLVVPVVVVVLGIYGAFPSFLIATPALLALEYVVLAMPYSYRAIDGGVQALDLHTLVDAGRSLGAGWPQVFRRLLLPNLRGSLLAAAFITIAYSLGEFAMANLLTFDTFPVQLFQIGTEQVDEATAVSVFALVLTFALLLVLSALGGRKKRARQVAGAAAPVGAPGMSVGLAAEVDAAIGTIDPGRPGIQHSGSDPAPPDEESR